MYQSSNLLYTSPIAFAQTREDSNIEASILINKPNSVICVIASAGDTICNLLTECDIAEIDAIDSNINQLYLMQLKTALIRYFNGIECWNFLEGMRFNDTEIIDMLDNLYQNNLIGHATYHFWRDNFDLLRAGVNQQGRFEHLFYALQNNGNINELFDHDHLTKIFGENATKYSMNNTFSDHFSGVFETYRKYYADPSQNYFYHQVLRNNYCRVPYADLPKYLETKSPIICQTKISAFCSDMMNFLCNSNKTYDLIHLSNITDWISPSNLYELFELCYNKLKMDGCIVVRRLNSDTVLADYLGSYFGAQFRIQSCLDKSLFYCETLVLQKMG